MDRLLARLERRLGRYAIEHLTYFIVGGMAIVFLLGQLQVDFYSRLTLDIGLVRAGQVWRLVTYLFLPTSDSMLWILFSLYWVWMVGSNLESEWGPLKFNLYYLIGMLGTTTAAWLTGAAVGNLYLNMSLFFAFATLFPNYEILMFFVLRIRVKWLGLLSAGYVGYRFALGDWVIRGAIFAATINYFVFFGEHLFRLLRSRNVQVRQAAKRASFRPPPVPTGGRACAICGATEDSGADIRICSCAKCAGPRSLCLEHARNH